MTAEQGFDLHPLAAQDITEIGNLSQKTIRLRLAVSARTY